MFSLKLHLNLVYEIKVNKHVFLSIHKTFQHKKGKNMSVLVASDLNPPPNVRIQLKRSGSATLVVMNITDKYWSRVFDDRLLPYIQIKAFNFVGTVG
jgi:hypothetical protein